MSQAMASCSKKLMSRSLDPSVVGQDRHPIFAGGSTLIRSRTRVRVQTRSLKLVQRFDRALDSERPLRLTAQTPRPTRNP
jgi:hypothetical protein